MLYSQETLQTAFTANAYPKALHREMLTVGEAEESQMYEQHKDMHHEEEMKKFMTMHQGDNYGYSDGSCDHNHSCEHWI